MRRRRRRRRRRLRLGRRRLRRKRSRRRSRSADCPSPRPSPRVGRGRNLFVAWLNYHHLLYFWTVARSGTIAAASKELHLSQPTISTQLKTLEDSLGVKLFARQGRRLVLTELGRTAFRYSD